MIKLNRKSEPLSVDVNRDEFVIAAEKAFDCVTNGRSEYFPWEKPEIPSEFCIGVIVGSSGSGKSTLLKEFGTEENPLWSKDKAIVSHFDNPNEAINKLTSVGLNSIPSWYRPYYVLSNGERFRADLATKIKNGAVIDEFTSVVDRNVAKAASVALTRYVKKNNIKNIVLSTCHRDILEWLEPDWVIDTDLGEYTEGFFLLDQKLKLTFIEQIRISGECLKTITI
jgi:ABC-type uncharacterized transport system ATPase subunit